MMSYTSLILSYLLESGINISRNYISTLSSYLIISFIIIYILLNYYL